ncbi:MAG: diacylglycerol kinase [Actinomycetota bacterium]|nr:diacylglycerol kinase [Actinomycetota bacterium]
MNPAASAIGQIALLTNPAAGHGKALTAAARAKARFAERGVQVRELSGRDAAESRELAQEAVADGIDALVVVGGDGMIHLALPAIVGAGTPLGVIPAGTGNDQAREHGWPRDAPEQAADVVADGHLKHVDVGVAETSDGETTYFGSVLASGFDSLVSDRTNRMRWPHGRARYNIAIVAEFANLQPLPFRIVLADDTVLEQEVLLVAVGNTKTYGGGMHICPNADPTDGLLDVTVVDAMPRRKAAVLMPRVFKGTHVELPSVQTFRTASLRIESPRINAYADGDYIGPLTVGVSLLPLAASLLTPALPRPD